ncbi:DHA1 family multidrug/chloramphenicol efflux transport protein-like MFS transporter [Rahnella sp. BIGb0236]|uniref:MFS transporter n=1 Tax=Rahnella sp. BIGb0236 TaxID=2485117 RepID=UPI001060F406|nr:MFS transporter [Rahnella sp. BIGb0236]TDS90299.1 DHA1 family multidrug/chloramphenicol efflux transport protein-like MFS transporter [Rahnella sp. BIGb0236]
MSSLSPPASTLSARQWLFPLSLVLFEFATYIAHDMIQPGMLQVISDFSASADWVSTSLTAYLCGGILLQWLLGPLSDRLGRRPVLLAGVAFFTVTCLLTVFTRNIEQFILMRFLQGMSLCFIGAVGYAAIQEAFSETLSVKLMALMANITLIAPLLGPLAGAAFIHYAPWKAMFALFALVSALSFWGLWRSMPETVSGRGERFSLRRLLSDYREVFSNSGVMLGSLSIGLITLPLLAWVAQSPVWLIQDAGMTPLQYGGLQVPVFTGLIIGNITLSKLSGKVNIRTPVWSGIIPIVLGLAISAYASLFMVHAWLWIIGGLSLYALGSGLVNAGLYRLTLFSSPTGKGTVAAALGLITIAVFAAGIEVAKQFYFAYGNGIFMLTGMFSGVAGVVLIALFLRRSGKKT